MKHFLPVSLLVFCFLSLLIIVKTVKPPGSSSISIDRSAMVSVSIGNPLLTLFGFTAPKSTVEVSGIGVFAQTQADSKGYFEFSTIYVLPLTREICLSSIDNKKQMTNPVCISTPAFNSLTRSVGPVILPPTVNLEKGQFLPGETIKASGQAIPNTQLSVSLFRAEPTLLNLLTRFDLVKEAYAATLPVYTIKTDQNGNFSFNLPSTYANTFRLFAQTNFDNAPSPKSNTLTFKVLTIFEFIIESICLFILFLLSLIKKLPFFETLIVIQILVLLILWRHKKYQLMIIQKDIERYDNKLSIYNDQLSMNEN